MNPRLRVSLIVGVGLIAAVGILEAAGRISGRDAAGKATGVGEGGCAEAPALPEERPADVRDAIQPAPMRDQRFDVLAAAEKDIVPGRYIVRLKDENSAAAQVDGDTLVSGDPDLDAAVGMIGIKNVRRVGQPSVKKLNRFEGVRGLISFESDQSLDEIDRAFEDVDAVLYVEPVIRVKPSAPPNDNYFGLQWHLQSQWMNASTAWDSNKGAGVVVAVIDSGVTAGGTDGLGIVLEGYDAFTGGNDGSDQSADEAGYSHGTFVASIIAQATNNASGVAGMAPDVSILPVKVLAWDEAYGAVVGTNETVAEGIRWAVDNGAHIMNLSLGSAAPSEAIREALIYAADNGVLCVAASGNDGSTSHVSYPAAYEECIAVGATDLNHRPTYYSNGGSALDIMAPGGDTTVDEDGDGYNDGILAETTMGEGLWTFTFGAGTSFAAPMVAATAAMVRSGGVTDPDDIRAALLGSAVDIEAAGLDTTSGFGEVSPVAALAYKAPAEVPAVEMSAVKSRRIGTSARYAVSWSTTVDADTVATDASGGQRYSDATLSSAHRAIVRLGKKETSLTVTFSSTDAAGNTDSETLTITK